MANKIFGNFCFSIKINQVIFSVQRSFLGVITLKLKLLTYSKTIKITKLHKIGTLSSLLFLESPFQTLLPMNSKEFILSFGMRILKDNQT